MARGWESKSVEEAQLEAEEARRSARKAPPPPTPEQMRQAAEIESLELACTRVRNDLAKVTNPRYREQLQSSLQHLEEKLAGLKAPATSSGTSAKSGCAAAPQSSASGRPEESGSVPPTLR